MSQVAHHRSYLQLIPHQEENRKPSGQKFKTQQQNRDFLKESGFQGHFITLDVCPGFSST